MTIISDSESHLKTTDPQKKPKARKWLARCGIGCAVLALVVVVGLSISTYFMQQPFREGIAAREALEVNYGSQSAFVPVPDGSISPSRVEVFLAVRRRLMTHCPVFEEIFGRFDRLDETDDDYSRLAAFEDVMRASRSVIHMGSATGAFFNERNTALLENGMGFGEYTYIYVLAYRAMLDSSGAGAGETDPAAGEDYGQLDRPSMTTHLSRIQRVHLAHLNNQLQAAEAAAGLPDSTDERWTRTIVLLRAEINALERRPGRLPWRDGSLPASVESLAPYRSQLDSLFCERTVEFEFVRNESRGLGIRGN